MTDPFIAELRTIVERARDTAPWRIYLFGSRATDNAQRSSDVDLLVRGAAPIPLAELVQFRARLEESNSCYDLDIVDYHRATPEFRERVLAAGAIELI